MDAAQYTNLVTSEHNQRPKFMAFLAALVQPFVDLQNLLFTLPSLFDVGQAVGSQLDTLGAWVGVSRNLKQAVGGVTVLDDTTYRILVKLYIAMNYWDGTVPGIYAAWNAILRQDLGPIVVVDNQDMTMNIFILANPGGVLGSLITSGYFTMRPAGVLLNVGFFQPSVPGAPIFGFGRQDATVSGWGTGAWAIHP